MPWTTLDTLDLEAITDAINRVFESFTYPTWITSEQMGSHLADNQVFLEHSPLWFSETDEVIGLAALAIRERRGWIAGFGISPEFRNQGFSHILIETVLQKAMDLGLKTVQLEVRTDNFPALRTYERAGFQIRRSLCTWKLAPESFLETITTAITAYPKRLDFVIPCWQREPETLQRMHDLQSLQIDEDSLQYRERPTDVSVHRIRAGTTERLSKLFCALQRLNPEQPLRILNEPMDSALSIYLKNWGWEESGDQYEMFWENNRCAS